MRVHWTDRACADDGFRVPSLQNRPVGEERKWPVPVLDEAVEFIDVVGAGGFGVVWRATMTGLHSGHMVDPLRTVAVKIAHPDVAGANERLAYEAQVLAAIGPPWVPQLHGSGHTTRGVRYLLMDFVHGHTLADRLSQQTERLSLEELRAVAEHILRAVAKVHKRGFIHRDLKPENIFLSDGGATLVDFGIARPNAGLELAGDHGNPRTRTDVALGTLEYMAPEQCQAQRAIDARADIYSLGVLLMELATGSPPFFGPAAEITHAHIHRRPPRLSGRRPDLGMLDGVIERCLAKKPADRYASVGQLSEALERALDSAEGADWATPSPGGEHALDRRARAASTTGRRTTTTERRQLVLLTFRTANAVTGVERLLAQWNIAIGDLDGCDVVAYVVVDDHPMRLALDAAASLIASGVCGRVLIHLDRVRVAGRSRDTMRLLESPERIPTDSDPTGVLLTEAARVMVPLSALRRCAGGLWRLDSAQAPTEAAPFLHDVPLVGRDDVIASLLEDAERAWAEHRPMLSTVLAPPGYGKTALAGAVRSRAVDASPGSRTVSIFIGPSAHQTPLAAQAHLLRTALGVTAEADDAVVIARFRELCRTHGDISGQSRDISEAIVSHVTGATGATARAVLPLTVVPGALDKAVLHTLGTILLWCARQVDMSVLIDDAHLARSQLLAIIDYMTRVDGDVRLWVCAFARPTLSSARPAWVVAGDRCRVHHLGPLSRQHADALAEDLFAPARDIPGELLDVFYRKTRGIPLLAVELARLLRAQGALRKRESGDWWYIDPNALRQDSSVPTARWLAQQTLERLPEPFAAHASLCALLGDDIEVQVLADVLRHLDTMGLGDEFPYDAGTVLRELCGIGLLHALPDSRYAFHHVLIREAVAEMANSRITSRKQVIHRAILGCYRSREDTQLATLAYHAAQADEPGAGDMYLQVADDAASRHLYREAELQYTRALALLPRAAQHKQMQAHIDRGRMRFRVDRCEEASHDFADAQALADSLGEREILVSIMLERAKALDWNKAEEASHLLVEEAQESAVTAVGAMSQLMRIRLELARGRGYWRNGEFEQALAILQPVREQASALGDDAYETHIIAMVLLVDILPQLNQVALAREIVDEALALAQARGDIQHIFGLLNNRRQIWIAENDIQSILEDMDECHALGRRFGVPVWRYNALCNRGEYLFQVGWFEEAWSCVRRGLSLERQLYTKPGSRYIAVLHARLLTYLGDIAGAREQLETVSRQALKDPWLTYLHDLLHIAIREQPNADDWNLLMGHLDVEKDYQQLTETAEFRALGFWRRGHLDLAGSWLDKALSWCDEPRRLMYRRAVQTRGRLRSGVAPLTVDDIRSIDVDKLSTRTSMTGGGPDE